MDQEPEFYVSPEDLEAQMTSEEKGERQGLNTQPSVRLTPTLD